MKGVFDTKRDSGYSDSLADWYHFPTRRDYMEVAQAVEGDWILYREPQRNGGRKAYIGTARVVSVVPDKDNPGHAYANVADFFPFDPPVPFSGAPNGRYWEASLRDIGDPALVGRSVQGKSLRLLSDADFAAIAAVGLGSALLPENLKRYGPTGGEANDVPSFLVSDLDDDTFVRRIQATLINRKVRDANFRRMVCQAYDDTCAVTGLRIINGGGRSEVQAAHIWPVEHGGPDTIRNGLALSGTVHWMFDRHLISLTDDYRLLVAHNRVPEALRGLFERQMDRIRLPKSESQWPDPKYVSRHRERYGA
ncbi:putative restriction endonuclease [Brevundimonas alba]|uniref:Putative restriction endonuclease n=1 Tax=Brevundimonas alba TaxID=74314 RepID=A0A7X6BLR5_9CAUL|nr:putative restriction endonuclease [Brevundimonas alba]